METIIDEEASTDKVRFLRDSIKEMRDSSYPLSSSIDLTTFKATCRLRSLPGSTVNFRILQRLIYSLSGLSGSLKDSGSSLRFVNTVRLVDRHFESLQPTSKTTNGFPAGF